MDDTSKSSDPINLPTLCSAQGGLIQKAARWAEHFARRFSAAATFTLGRSLEARPAGSDTGNLSQFLAAGEETGCGFRLSSPWGDRDETIGAVEFSPPVAFALVDRLLGGRGDNGTYVPNRSLTELERGLLGRLGDLAGRCMTNADSPSPPLADEDVIVIGFEVVLEKCRGTMRLAVGHAILTAPIDDAVATSPAGRNRVRLSVVPALTAVTGEDISDLSPGDILASDTLVDGEVFLQIGDETRFAARLARSNGRRVAIITRRIPDKTTTRDHSQDEE